MDGNGPFIDGLHIRNGWTFIFFRGVGIPPTRWLLDVISHLLTGMHMQLVGFHILQPPRGAQPPTSQEPGQSSLTEMARQLMHGPKGNTFWRHWNNPPDREYWKANMANTYSIYFHIPFGKDTGEHHLQTGDFHSILGWITRGFCQVLPGWGTIFCFSANQCHQIGSIPLPSSNLT